MMIDRKACLDQLHTIRDYIRFCYSKMIEHKVYFGHGHVSAADEAKQLVLAGVSLPWDADQFVFDSQLLTTEKNSILDFIERRVIEREPLPYIISEAWFMGMPFYVDRRVLVPRSPIAQLIETEFSPFLRQGPVNRVLDLCTGSGCIGIACAFAFEEAAVDLADISQEALEVAKLNIDKYELTDQVSVIESDVFNRIPHKYDVIVSNPPYVDLDDLTTMPSEFGHEPALALGSGVDGLDICKRILKQANDFLADDGLLVVEVGNSEIHLMEQYPQIPFIWVDLPMGGNGVFVISAEELKQYRHLF